MQRYHDVIQDPKGNGIAAATVRVKKQDGSLAQLFQDRAGTQPLNNPLLSGADGEFSFCAADGTYNLEVEVPGFMGETLQEVQLLDIDTLGDVYAETAQAAVAASQGYAQASAASAALAQGYAAETEGKVGVLRADLASVSVGKGAGMLGFLQRGTGALVRWILGKLRERVSILDFIPEAEHDAISAGTSTYDCASALRDAISSVTCGTGYYISGPAVYFPPGVYRFGSTIEIKRSVRLFGDSAGHAWDGAARLKFASGVPGFIVHSYNTIGSTVEAVPTTSASSTSFDGLVIEGSGGATANGIHLRVRALIRNCRVRGFSGNNIHIAASAGSGGAMEGNANNWRIEGGRTEAAGGHGLYVDGADANAGYCIGLDASQNTGWGIYDSSFLGNTYVATHAAQNGLGPYKSDDANARNIFVGCYSEGGQPASEILSPSFALGGLHGAGVNGIAVEAGLGKLILKAGLRAGSVDLGYGQAAAAGTGLTLPDTSGTQSWTLEKAVGRWGWKWAGAGTPGFLSFLDRTATVDNGYARDLSAANGALLLGSHYVGAISQMRSRSLGTAAPTTGDWLQGDIVWNLTPGASGILGWYCTASGAPGTWRTISIVGNGTGTAAPTTGTWSQGEYVKNTAPVEAGTSPNKYIVRGWMCVAAGTPGTWVPDRGLTGN